MNRFRRGQKAHKAQQGFDKLLAGTGEWEIVKGRGRAITPAPAYIWDALASYAPLAAEIAATAANAASAAKYFEVLMPAAQLSCLMMRAYHTNDRACAHCTILKCCSFVSSRVSPHRGGKQPLDSCCCRSYHGMACLISD